MWLCRASMCSRSCPCQSLACCPTSPSRQCAQEYRALLDAARGLGCPLSDPYMAMAFLALPVIPALKLTDQGLVDVEQFALCPLFVDQPALDSV